MSRKAWEDGSQRYSRHKSPNQYEYDDEEDDDDSCGFICFALGVIFLFVGVAILATVIVYSQSPEDHSSVVSLTSTREIKPVSELLMSSILKPSSIRVVDHSPNKSSETPSPLRLLIIVTSLPESVEKRKAIRQTWMKDAQVTINEFQILVRFAIPGMGLSAQKMTSLKEESATFKDVVVLSDSSEKPESEMLLFELLWATQRYKFTYIMKTRDNMYVRINQLYNNVLKDLIEGKSNAYLGYFEGNGDPKALNKLPEPDWFLCDHYIRYAHSGGYILSEILVKRLLSQAKFLHPYNNEDVAMGTWLSPFKDVDLIHNIYFDTELGKPRGCNDKLIVFQPAKDEPLSVVHKRLAATGSCCAEEFSDIPPYNYDFYVLPSKCCSAL